MMNLAWKLICLVGRNRPSWTIGPVKSDLTMSALLDKFKKGIQQITIAEKVINEATKASEKVLNDGQTKDEFAAFSSLWEQPEFRDFCRNCNNRIQVRKHHCRSCGGVFCDDCCQMAVPDRFQYSIIPRALKHQPTQPIRLCEGCRRGECPGRPIIERIRRELDEIQERKDTATGTGNSILDGAKNTIEKISNKVAAKMGEAIELLSSLDGNDEYIPPSIKLTRGSYYGENGLTRRAPNNVTQAAVSGYFELFNKTAEVIGVKLNRSFGEKYELPRPSYIAGILC